MADTVFGRKKCSRTFFNLPPIRWSVTYGARYEVSGLHECGIARVMRPKRPLRTKPSDTAPISPVDKDAAIETGTEASTDIDPRSDIDGSSVYGLSRVESKASETVYCG